MLDLNGIDFAFGVLADVATGYPELLCELTLTTALRTAAMSALAARTLARPDSRVMALIGNGAQSEFQAIAFQHLVGIDTLQVAAVAPDLLPRPLTPLPSDDASDADGAAPDRLAFFAPDTVFLNPMARQQLQSNTVRLQMGLQLRTVRVAGSVPAGGGPLAVMDIAAVQDL